MHQTPHPGSRTVAHRGDVLTIELQLDRPASGLAWVRTNVGKAMVARREAIVHAEQARLPLAHDWHDLPMTQIDGRTFRCRLALAEVGVFAFKCCFQAGHSATLDWPDGDNAAVKVEPAETVAANGIYTAFVRQFGRHLREAAPEPDEQTAIGLLEGRDFTVIPPSGTFRQLLRHLDFIRHDLGFRILQLLPVHPVPTTYARMGRFGSPFAVLDLCAIDPALAEFDRLTTPLDQFRELIDAAHARDMRVYMDVPLNHTGWASALQLHHSDWYIRNDDATFHSPGAWGVTWADLSKLDYRKIGLWQYMADALLHWCSLGVNGFRCDAGYMVPLPVWNYISAKVRQQYPDTVLFLEGLGGKQETTEALLSAGGMNWAYSELFQTDGRDAIRDYLGHCRHVSRRHGTLVHFAETHDNNRLAATSFDHARMRTALSALAAVDGAFGITCGVEWFATEKIDVHEDRTLHWGRAENQVGAIGRINRLLAEHPAFQAGAEVAAIESGHHHVLALYRRSGTDTVLVLVNLDTAREATAAWAPPDAPGIAGVPAAPDGAFATRDLLSGQCVDWTLAQGRARAVLPPAAAWCLARPDAVSPPQAAAHTPARIRRQQFRATVLDVLARFHGPLLPGVDVDALAAGLAADPWRGLCRIVANDHPFVTRWTWPADLRRLVMVPPEHMLMVHCPHPFRLRLLRGNEAVATAFSLGCDDGRHVAILTALHRAPQRQKTELEMTVYAPDGTQRASAEVRLLPPAADRAIVNFAHTGPPPPVLNALCTNGRGAMSWVRADWGRLDSQYDCLLGANLDDQVPVDRHILLRRLRAWIVHRSYSQELTGHLVERFCLDDNGAVHWDFIVPTGMGQTMRLHVELAFTRGTNRIVVRFERRPAPESTAWIEDTEPVALILRPDIDDRNAHFQTKAYLGAEAYWPAHCRATPSGFTFEPEPARILRVELPTGRFVWEPEWQYMQHHPFEAQRGLEAHSDHFSPGYFQVELFGSSTVTLIAAAADGGRRDGQPIADIRDGLPAPAAGSGGTHEARGPAPAGVGQAVDAACRRAIQDFIVTRDRSHTVIAGYPWFLDWGRDTLIALRGIIAAGFIQHARDILVQFARFEQQGTLPNMIRGNDHSNRDTSDAPLWFFVACGDLLRATDDSLLDEDCGGRTLRAVLQSLAHGYRNGTPNGIRMDPDSGLVFSPSHFTWMDTNFPAGSPRQGYPIEIQALWHRALRLLAQCDPAGDWAEVAACVQQHVAGRFAFHWRDPSGMDIPCLADCLHAPPGTPAARATRDDAIRSNQLLAVTLGCVQPPELRTGIVLATECLLVPGAIRSLADAPVHVPQPVYRDAQLLNDPHRPYWGTYGGDEDTRRKPAYHNGTAWTWPFPSYPEALYLVHGAKVRTTALALLDSVQELLRNGCLGHLPEILDGDAPHTQRGCGAQAWGITEYHRVRTLLATN